MARKVKNPTRPFDPKVESILLRADQKWNAGDLRSAFRLFLAAAKCGDEIGQLNLGYFYDVGIGVKRNRTAAMHWYMRSYRKGNGSGANNIGTILRDEDDTTRALHWFERAVQLGEIDSNLDIAKLYIREGKQVSRAIMHLKRVVRARAGVDVTVDSHEQAQRLLKEYGARR